MRRSVLSAGRWSVIACVVGGSVWACGGTDKSFFDDGPRGGQGPSGGSSTGGTSGSSGASSGGSPSGGASGSSTGGSSTGGTTGDGGAAADGGEATGGTGGTATGGTPTGGAGASTGGNGGAGGAAGPGGAGMGGGAGTQAMGGAGMSGAGVVGGAAGSNAGGAGKGDGGKGSGGKGGGPNGDCRGDSDCSKSEYCKKDTCDAEQGVCQARGPECRGTNAVFDPICGCDGITYWNTCVIEHEGFNAAKHGECTGPDRPICTRDEGPASCPPRIHAHCYRAVEACGDGSPLTGVCWVLPQECPQERATQRYCGGTAGAARCIGLCEVMNDENSFQRDAPQCAATTN